MEELRGITLDFAIASKDVIEIFLDEADDPTVFEEIFNANQKRPEILRLLYDHPSTPEPVRVATAKALSLPVKVSTEIEEARTKELAKPREVKVESLTKKMQRLSVAERIKLALRGGREIRSILLKDTNKEVILSVLDNPKITETEIEMIARSRNVPDEALRIVAKNREWMKNYAVLYALVTNPKTPAGIALGFISSLKLKDLSLLEKNKNVAEVVRSAAKRLLAAKKKNA